MVDVRPARSSRTYRRYLLSYLSVLLLPLVVMSILNYLTAVRYTTTLTRAQLQEQLGFGATLLERELQDVREISYRIVEDSTFRTRLLTTDVTSARAVIEELHRFQTTNSIIAEIFFAPLNHPYVYTSNTTVRRDQFREFLVVLETVRAEQLVIAQEQLRAPTFVASTETEWRFQGIPSNVLLIAFPIRRGTQGYLGRAVFAMETDRVVGLFDQALGDLAVTTILLGANNTVLATSAGSRTAPRTGSRSVETDVLVRRNSISGDADSILIDGVRFVIARATVPAFGLRVVAIVPERELLRNVRRLQLIILTLIGVVLVTGLFLARRFARATYLPVHELAELLPHPERMGEEDEWTIIMNGLAASRDDVRRGQSRALNSSQALRVSVVRELLQGAFADWEALRRERDTAGLSLAEGPARVAVVYSEQFRSCENVQDVCESALPDGLSALGFPELSGVSAIYVVAADPDVDVAGRAEQWRIHIKAATGGLVTIGLGDANEDLSALPRSLSQARNALEYRFILGEDRVIQPTDYAMQSWDPNWYPMVELEELEATLRTGDVERTRRLFGQIIAVIRESGIPLPEVRGLAFDVIRLVRRSFARYKYLRIAGATDADDVEAFLMVRSIDHLAQIVERVSEEAALVIADRRQIEVRRFREQASAFVQDHLTDASFSAELVAEQFGMGGSNFSQYFSKAFGESFQDYVIRVRIDRSKILLATGELSVAEVAHAVGYSDVSGFIRRFKSIVGVTPARYRDRL